MTAFSKWFLQENSSARLLVVLALFTFAFGLAICKMSCVEDGTVYAFGADDMMICMRYAYNCAHGLGLVYNAGERVQGYTNLGWTLFMTVVHYLRLPIGLNFLVIQLTNLVLELVLITYWFVFLRRNYSEAFALAGCFIIAFNQSLFSFGFCGFETTLLALIVSVATSWCILKPDDSLHTSATSFWMPLWAAVYTFFRADGVVLFISAILASLVAAWIKRASKSEWAAILLSTLCGIIVIGGMLFWQKQYYGDYLPNTYYLKCNASLASVRAGLRSLFVDYGIAHVQIGFLFGFACYLVRGLGNRQQWIKYVPVSLIVLPFFTYAIGVGGDYWHLGRLYTPVAPLLVVCSLIFLRDEISKRLQVKIKFTQWPWDIQILRVSSAKTIFLAEGVGILIGTALVFFPLSLIPGLNGAKVLNSSELAVVHVLRQMHLSSSDLIAAARAGTVPYYLPEYRFHDILGRCDTYISHLPVHEGQLPGHNKFDYSYSLGRLKPEVLLTSHPLNDKLKERMEKKIKEGKKPDYLESFLTDEDFQKYYAPNRVHVPISIPNGDIIWVYRRKEPVLRDQAN